MQKSLKYFKHEKFDLHIKSNTLLSADVFENFQEKCLKADDLDLDQF